MRGVEIWEGLFVARGRSSEVRSKEGQGSRALSRCILEHRYSTKIYKCYMLDMGYIARIHCSLLAR
jgi:hypothetical protein